MGVSASRLESVRDTEKSRTVTSVDAVVIVLEDVVVDVTVAETERWGSGVEVLPVVVGVGHLDGDILSSVAVGVSHQRRLPMVVEVRVGYRDGV